MDQISIKLKPLGKTLKANKGVQLIDVLHEYGVEFPCAGNGTCGKCKIKLLEGDIEVDDKHQKALKRLRLGNEWRLACFCKCYEDVTFEIDQYNSIILADETTFDITPQKGFGVAVDIGTTTVVAQLLNLETGAILGVEKMRNPQSKFGADLISRIQKALEGNELELTQILRLNVGKMIQNLIDAAQVTLSKVVLVGNTVMQHSFCGFSLKPLSSYPFDTPNGGMQKLETLSLGWNFKVDGDVLFYPSIGAFVGSDILAGIVSTRLFEKKEYSILVDLGTNGEIVVGNKDRILCASTAAGPAFEGANISQGMQATTGALSSISKSNNDLQYHIIGGGYPRGICGSGLLDAIAMLRKESVLGIFGEISNGNERVDLVEGVSLTQKDISEFLLAKSAIATGIYLLLKKLGVTKEEISEVYIAGGFGNYIELDNVSFVGMLEFAPGKIRKMGNTALIGAKMLLFEDVSFINPIVNKIEHISLESISEFQDVFVEKMMLV